MTACERPSYWQIKFRQIAVASTGFLLRNILIDPHNGLIDGEQYLKDGYGIIVLMNHFSKRDAPQVLKLLFSNDCFRQRPFVAPVARHHYRPAVRYFSEMLGFRIQPIVNTNTVRLLGDRVKLGDGLVDYLQAAMACLTRSGVVLLAPQGGRKPTLGKPVGRPLGSLLAQAKRHSLERLALMFIGLGICEAKDYAAEKVSGSNFHLIYQMKVGKTLPAAQALKMAGGRKNVDAWSFDVLSQLVPSVYVGTDMASEPLADDLHTFFA